MVYVILLQLLILCFGIADMLPFSISSEQETRTFRWTTDLDLQNTSCAVGLDFDEIYNFTIKNNEIENYRTGVRFYGFAPYEMQKEKCESNGSLFMLVGNPGVVWHLETGLCVKTKVQTQAVRGVEPNAVYMTSKFLTTGRACEHDDPDVARFKFNQNRPQRLSFVANVDPKTGKQEEWCIRNWLGEQLQVVPDCDGNNPFTNFQLPEVYFLEVIG